MMDVLNWHRVLRQECVKHMVVEIDAHIKIVQTQLTVRQTLCVKRMEEESGVYTRDVPSQHKVKLIYA